MTIEEAGHVVAYLNAAFPRDVLEPESAAIWIREVSELHSYDAGLEAAKLIGRNGERFPTIREFRLTYRNVWDRIKPRELELTPMREPVPEEVQEWLRAKGMGSFEEVFEMFPPATERVPERPVWARHLRRMKGGELAPPSDREKHDAIIVLRYENGDPLGRLLATEALRIMDECS